MHILVTGGAGYIGSHTCLELLNEGYEVTVVDNLSNSSQESLKRVETLSGKEIKFYKVDILDKQELEKVFRENNFDAVIHFAGLKAVAESVEKPLYYYQNNLSGSLVLFELMNKYNTKNLIFSSSATVYGFPKDEDLPLKENAPRSLTEVTNPYGKSKFIIEEFINDIYASDNSWNAVILRYFNPVGAHKSGMIGEDPNGIPNNLAPYVAQVAIGKLPFIKVTGNDYPTADGTGVRDYIHVVDLALGHVKALQKIKEKSGLSVYNLGTGRPYSVLEVIAAFSKAVGKQIPYKFAPRRPGDLAASYADASKAKEELGWVATRDIDEMCADSWRWQSQNPNGFKG